MEISAGIPEDIDLTERGVFRQGVKEILHPKEYKHGELPWYSDGRLKFKKKPKTSIYYNLSDSFHIREVDLDDSIISSQYDYVDDEYNERLINLLGKNEVTEDPMSLLPYIKEYGIKIIGDDIFCKFVQWAF